LFRRLDAARERSVVWLTAPAGYGKTTLAASYLAARKIKPLWYRFDERDADPAAFFYYLRLAMMRQATRKNEPLALLTPEYLPGLPVFTRNFFDGLFRRLSAPAVLVFDDYHVLSDAAVLQELLPKVLAEAPRGVSVLVLSRSMPPPGFASLRAKRLMRVFDADALSLTIEEVRGIARLQGRRGLSARVLEALYPRVRGWAAAWMVLLERARAGDLESADIPHGARETLFDYFVAELFSSAAPEVQALLLKTALLPQVSAAMALAMTGGSGAAAVLAELERRNYFTARLSAGEAIYEFHPLFREFLLARLQQALPEAEQRFLRRTAARLLCENGRHDEAIGLLVESAHWDALAELILQQAPHLVEQGRVATLQAWIEALPPAVRGQNPWLEYWFGTCRLAYGPIEARSHFERAYEAFKQRDDARGMYCALSCVMHPMMIGTGTHAALDHWLGELLTLERRFPLVQHPEVEPQVAYTALMAIGGAGEDWAEASRWVERAEALSRSRLGDERLELLILNGLNVHYYWTGAIEQARATRERLIKRLETAKVDPVLRLQCYVTLVVNTWFTGDLELGTPWAEAGLRLGEDIGVRMLDLHFTSHAFYVAEQAHDLDRAEAALNRCSQVLFPGNRVDEGQYWYMKGSLAWQRGDLASAREYAERIVALCEQLQLRFMVAHARLNLAQVLVEFGEFDRALRLRELAREYAARARNPVLLALGDLTEAWIALRRGDPKTCAAALARGFAFTHRQRCAIYMGTNARMMAPLCEFALARGIEPEYARFFIRRWHLPPSEAGLRLEDWPWPVKVDTLGHFAVVIDDKPLRFAGKAQRKPLELLQALIAFGGRDVREDKLAEALWPDAEADLAAQTLSVTQHRLRKLIGDAAIVRREHRLSLDPRQCRVDVWALERQLALAEDHIRARQVDRLAQDVEALFALYRGPFLNDADEHSWVLSMRERLRGRFLHQLEAAADCFERMERHELARRCLERGLEIDPLVEKFYRGLMRVHLAQGERAEALATYRRCRDVLATHFGLAPSAETRALARDIDPGA
jgi:DNA-binding SARP family transcriptional activator